MSSKKLPPPPSSSPSPEKAAGWRVTEEGEEETIVQGMYDRVLVGEGSDTQTAVPGS